MGLRGLLYTTDATRLPRLFDYALQRRRNYGRQRLSGSCIALEAPDTLRQLSNITSGIPPTCPRIKRSPLIVRWEKLDLNRGIDFQVLAGNPVLSPPNRV